MSVCVCVGVGENDLGLTFGFALSSDCVCVCISAWACVVVCALLVILCGLSLQAHTDTHIQRDTHPHTCSGTLKIGRQVDALSLSLSAKASSAARSSQAAQKTVESSGEREEWGEGGEQQPEVKSPRQTLEGVAGAEEDFNFELSKRRRRSWSKGRQIFLYAGLCDRVCVCVCGKCLPVCRGKNSFDSLFVCRETLSSQGPLPRLDSRVSPVRIVWLSPHTAAPRPGNQRAMWHSFALSENEGHGCVGIGVSVCVCRWFPKQRQAHRGEAKRNTRQIHKARQQEHNHH